MAFARLDAILTLWGDGQAGAEIGRRVGVSRNAVLGKIDRTRTKFGAALLTLERVAEHLADGGDHRDFDGDEMFGTFALAEMRRGLGRQAQ